LLQALVLALERLSGGTGERGVAQRLIHLAAVVIDGLPGAALLPCLVRDVAVLAKERRQRIAKSGVQR
jgi:hypothetical protein